MTCWTKLLQVFNIRVWSEKKITSWEGNVKFTTLNFRVKQFLPRPEKNLFSPKIQCSVRSQNVYQALSYNVSVIIFCTASCKVQNVRWLLGRQIITFVCHDLDNFFSSLYVRERLQKTEDTSDKSSFSKAFSSSEKCVGVIHNPIFFFF